MRDLHEIQEANRKREEREKAGAFDPEQPDQFAQEDGSLVIPVAKPDADSLAVQRRLIASLREEGFVVTIEGDFIVAIAPEKKLVKKFIATSNSVFPAEVDE